MTPKTNTVSIDSEFGVMPNPSGGSFAIKYELLNDAKVQVLIYNSLGNLVVSSDAIDQSVGINTIEFNHQELAEGIYIVRFLENDTIKNTEKIIIKK